MNRSTRWTKVFAPRPVASSLSRHLLRTVVRVSVCFTMFAAAYVGGLHLVGSEHGVSRIDYVAPEHGAVAVSVEGRRAARAARLVERHDCWMGEAPADMAGEVPGGVVMSIDGRGPQFYSAERMVGLALDVVFVGPQRDAVIHGFCR